MNYERGWNFEDDVVDRNAPVVLIPKARDPITVRRRHQAHRITKQNEISAQNLKGRKTGKKYI
jgi:hypothetical protein